MDRLFKIPFYFLCIGSLIGLLLRFHFVLPIGGLKYANWLHAHSHTMFLGWIFNFLLLAFIRTFLQNKCDQTLRWIIILLQLALLGMLVAFPLQGYGVYSISLSVLHTGVSVWFCVLFFKRTRSAQHGPPLWFARASLVFFIIASTGAISLGPLAAGGLKGTKWYYFAILFYLHFQYNGTFLFGGLALLLDLFRKKGIDIPAKPWRVALWLLFAGTIATYFLSVMSAEPSITVVLLCGVGVALLVGSVLVTWASVANQVNKIVSFSGSSRRLLLSCLLAYALKIILQVASVHPSVSILAAEVRFFVVAYLHLILIGVISFFLILWAAEQNIIKPLQNYHVALLVIGFAGSEVVMICIPLLGEYFNFLSVILLLFSFLLALAFFLILRFQRHQWI